MKNEYRLINKSSKRLIVAPIFLGFILLPCLIFGLFKIVTFISPDTRATYHELMVNSGLKKDDLKKSPYQVSQDRSQVQKDVSFIKNKNFMHLRLLAKDAKLVLDHQGQKKEVIEHMNQVVCYMQEELYYLLPDGKEAVFAENGQLVLRNPNKDQEPNVISRETPGIKPMQIMRQMEADTGSYYYKADLFQAKNVTIQRFVMEGHEFLPMKVDRVKLISGVADSVEFSLNKKNFEFKADKLKAILYERSNTK